MLLIELTLHEHGYRHGEIDNLPLWRISRLLAAGRIRGRLLEAERNKTPGSSDPRRPASKTDAYGLTVDERRMMTQFERDMKLI